MTRIMHLSVKKSAHQARMTLAELDWPHGLAVPVESLHLDLLWLPFNAVTGISLLDAHKEPALSSLSLSSEMRSEENIAQGQPEGTCLPPQSKEDDVLFVPYFLFHEDTSKENFAAVDAIHGNLAGGKLTVRNRSALARLGLLVLFTLYVFFLGTAYMHQLLAMVFSALGPMLRLTSGVIIQIIVIGLLLTLFYWLLRWMNSQRKRLLTILREPIRRAESRRVTLPLDPGWLPILKEAGNVTVVLAPLIALSLILYGSIFNMFHNLLRGLQLILVLVFSAFALQLSRKHGLLHTYTESTNRVEEDELPKGAAADTVKVLLDVTLLAIYGMLVGHVLDLFGYGRTIGELLHIDPGLLSGHGVRAGALCGVIVSGISWQNRLTLAAGMIGALATEFFISPWIGIPLMLVLVAIVSLTTSRSNSSDSPPESPYWEALRTAWAYGFGSAMGGIGGRIVGLVFMGPAGMVIGGVLGDRVLATATLMTRQSS